MRLMVLSGCHSRCFNKYSDVARVSKFIALSILSVASHVTELVTLQRTQVQPVSHVHTRRFLQLLLPPKCMYSSRDQAVRFAYVTSLRVEGKQTNILCN
jgi:hypothetical protein